VWQKWREDNVCISRADHFFPLSMSKKQGESKTRARCIVTCKLPTVKMSTSKL
jgi:hypothetical protein